MSASLATVSAFVEGAPPGEVSCHFLEQDTYVEPPLTSPVFSWQT